MKYLIVLMVAIAAFATACGGSASPSTEAELEDAAAAVDPGDVYYIVCIGADEPLEVPANDYASPSAASDALCEDPTREVATTEPTASTVPATAPPTTEPPNDGLGTLDNPLPVGSEVTFVEEFGTDEWIVTVDSVVKLVNADYVDESDPIYFGECWAILGTATPVVIEDGLTSAAFTIPEMDVLTDLAQSVDNDAPGCESSDLQAEGYGELYDATVPVGSTFFFFSPFRITEALGTSPEFVVVNNELAYDVRP